jgi:hypothetical protein
MKRTDFIQYDISQKRRDDFWLFAAGCDGRLPFTHDHILEKRENFRLDWIFDAIQFQIERQPWKPHPEFSWSHYHIAVQLEAGTVRVIHMDDSQDFEIPIINILRGLV